MKMRTLAWRQCALMLRSTNHRPGHIADTVVKLPDGSMALFFHCSLHSVKGRKELKRLRDIK